MEENSNKEGLDPRDLNGDGKVTLKENAEDLEDKAEDAIDTLKQKFQEKKDSKEA